MNDIKVQETNVTSATELVTYITKRLTQTPATTIACAMAIMFLSLPTTVFLYMAADRIDNISYDNETHKTTVQFLKPVPVNN